MRVARITIAAVAALAMVSLGQVGLAEPAKAAPTGPGISWQYSSEANAYWRPPADTPAPSDSGPLLAWTQYSGVKDLTCPAGNPAYACEGPPAEIVGIYCSDLPGPTGLPTFAWIRWERTPEPDGTMGPWIGKDADCDEPGDDDVITMDEIRVQTRYANIFQALPEPELAIAPAPQGLVNLPVIVSTDYPNPDDALLDGLVEQRDPIRLRIRVEIQTEREPFVGFVSAWLDDYVWTFKDGGTTVKTISGRGKGTPYDPAVDPRANPGHYISHTYAKAGGGKTITVSTTWVGRVLVPGIADEPIEPVTITRTSDPFSVVEAKSVIGDR